MSDLIIIDNTTLAAMQTCDTLAAVRYVLGHTMSEESGPLICGSAIHTALDVWFKSGHDIAAALAAFETAYKPRAGEHAPEDRDWFRYENEVAILRLWFATHPPPSLRFYTKPELIGVE